MTPGAHSPFIDSLCSEHPFAPREPPNRTTRTNCFDLVNV